jgi:hypothetical protein
MGNEDIYEAQLAGPGVWGGASMDMIQRLADFILIWGEVMKGPKFNHEVWTQVNGEKQKNNVLIFPT